MPWNTIDFEENNGLALVRLNRPEALNALSRRMAQDLCEVCERCNEPDIRAMVLTGAGRAFSAGGDLKEIGERLKTGERMGNSFGRTTRRLWRNSMTSGARR